VRRRAGELSQLPDAGRYRRAAGRAFIFEDYFRRKPCQDIVMIGMTFTGIAGEGGAAATMKTVLNVSAAAMAAAIAAAAAAASAAKLTTARVR